MATEVKTFFDEDTYTLTYIVYSSHSKQAVVIDPVWDFDYASGKLSSTSVDEVDVFLKEHNLDVKWILETHVHADHISGAQKLKAIYPAAQVGINENIKTVQTVFSEMLNLKNFPCDGSQFDVLLADNQEIELEDFTIKVLFTPGHTPACTSFVIENALFVGDAIFMPDYGTGRCDFPKGDAKQLYDSIQKLYAYPDETLIYVGHDYQPGGRELAFKTTVGDQKKHNIQLKAETSQAEFVQFRTQRDKKLNAPKLLLPSIQVNMNGAQLPPAESNQISYLKIPLSGA